MLNVLKFLFKFKLLLVVYCTYKFGGVLYHQQPNKRYSQMYLLAHFEGTPDFTRSEFTCQ